MSALLLATEVLEKLVLLGLMGLSVWSVSIMIATKRKLNGFKRWSETESSQIEALISQAQWSKLELWEKNNPDLITAQVLNSAMAMRGAKAEAIDRSIKCILVKEKMKLEKGMSVLATLGANAPFIGLFGTVLGIIRSFAALADNQGAATSVMSGISQALYATAAGLFVAIPAVIAYNSFSSHIRNQMLSAEILKDFFIAHKEKV